MANSTLTASIIAKEAVMILDNELVMGNKVNRAYEKEFDKKVNGYKAGASVDIRRPADFTVRDGATASSQDVVEGSTTVTVDKFKGIDFEFSSTDLTLSIDKLSERVIQPAMVQLANQVDQDLHDLYKQVPNWVGTPGEEIDSFADFYAGQTRLVEYGVPMQNRCATLSPGDHGAFLGSQVALYNDTLSKPAYRKGETGMVGQADLYATQNTPTHTVGAHAGTPLVNGGSQDTTFAATKSTDEQTLVTDGWSTSVNGILKEGDVFTIAGVYAVNPVTKATLPFLKQFVVKSDANSDGSGNATLTISPAIIASGSQKTVSAAPADNAAITVMGTASTGYRQNMIFHKNAFALTSVPLVSPPGAVDVARETYKGLNVRVIPYYDGTNDVSKWRLDILYGADCVDPRLATRLSGAA